MVSFLEGFSCRCTSSMYWTLTRLNVLLQDLCAEAWSSGIQWNCQYWRSQSPPPASLGPNLLQANGPAGLRHRAPDLRVYQPPEDGGRAARLGETVVCCETEPAALLEEPRGRREENA